MTADEARPQPSPQAQHSVRNGGAAVSLGGTTARLLLIVDDPDAIWEIGKPLGEWSPS